MNSVTGSTSSEKTMIKAVQAAIGAVTDGAIGTQTMSDLARMVGADCFPLTLKIWGAPVIIGNDILAFSPQAPLSYYANTLSGSFTYPSGKTPCSILVNKGVVVCSAACHAFLDYPESVLYRLDTGEVGIQRCLSSDELPAGVRWAVGGMGLLDKYDPGTEGFSGDYADVLRDTNHTVLGIKGDHVYLVYCSSMTAAQVNTFVRDKLKLDLAVMLDGGHLAAIFGTESFTDSGQACKSQAEAGGRRGLPTGPGDPGRRSPR